MLEAVLLGLLGFRIVEGGQAGASASPITWKIPLVCPAKPIQVCCSAVDCLAVPWKCALFSGTCLPNQKQDCPTNRNSIAGEMSVASCASFAI